MSVVIKNPKGVVEISTGFFANLAGFAATTCYGVVGMVTRSGKDGLAKLLKIENMDKGVKVRIEDNAVSVDLFVMVEYGISINTVCQSIKNKVKYQLETITGQEIKSVNIFVEGVRID